MPGDGDADLVTGFDGRKNLVVGRKAGQHQDAGLRLRHAQYGHLPRLALGLSGLVNLSIMVSFLMAVYFLLNADAEGYFPPVPMHSWLAVAPVISIALTLAMFYLGRKAGWSDRTARLYNFILLVNSGFTLFMGYWGLIGGSL